MNLSGKKIIKGLLLFSLIAIVLAVVYNMGNVEYGSKVGIIEVDGVIGAQTTESLFSLPSTSVLSQVRAAEQDPTLQALVIRVNSPGGAAGTSEELYNTILRIRESGIPVVVSMGDTAASGGYYLAAAADYIYANGSTMTGSIGVIMETVNLSGLYEMLGVEFEVIKSGEFKDTGNASRSLTDRESELLNALIYDAWDQFVEDVAVGRNLDRDHVESIADGRIMTGRQALEFGLVDELGGLDEAIDKAIELAGISGPIIFDSYTESHTWYERVLLTFSNIPQLIQNLPQQSVSLKYQL